VLSIIALVSVALPFAANRVLPNRALDLAESQLIDDLKAARRAAATSASPVALQFDPSGSSYRTATRERNFSSGITMQIKSPLTGDSLRSFAWYPDGSNPGARMELTLGERMRAVHVNPLTGAVSSERAR
jgi:hypothetical protein